jgi:hypothetical protein
MVFVLRKTLPRVWSLEAGVAMVVTDLHGDWDTYRRYRDRFVDLNAVGQADYLILTGDLIHREDEATPDRSLEIVLDVIAMQREYGQSILYLCGNHELPHIYSFILAKNGQMFTPSFEVALAESQRRAEIIALFDSLPFYVRTRAGLSLTHAGAASFFVETQYINEIMHWRHQHLLGWATMALESGDLEFLRRSYASRHHLPYDALAKYYLAVAGPDDPRYNDLLRGFVVSNHAAFDRVLWPALSTRCEKQYGRAYSQFLEAMLDALSIDFFPQQALVAGHMPTNGGYELVGRRHLRLSSGCHATPQLTGQYLLVDTARPIKEAKDLLPGLGSIYA